MVMVETSINALTMTASLKIGVLWKAAVSRTAQTVWNEGNVINPAGTPSTRKVGAARRRDNSDKIVSYPSGTGRPPATVPCAGKRQNRTSEIMQPSIKRMENAAN